MVMWIAEDEEGYGGRSLHFLLIQSCLQQEIDSKSRFCLQIYNMEQKVQICRAKSSTAARHNLIQVVLDLWPLAYQLFEVIMHFPRATYSLGFKVLMTAPFWSWDCIWGVWQVAISSVLQSCDWDLLQFFLPETSIYLWCPGTMGSLNNCHIHLMTVVLI